MRPPSFFRSRKAAKLPGNTGRRPVVGAQKMMRCVRAGVRPAVERDRPAASAPRRRFAALCLTAVICLTNVSLTYATDADNIFAKANRDYAARHFHEAIAGFESLVKSGQWSASLFYDLGNAYFRAGDLGRAILNYERALALEPAQPEAQANLRLVRDQARALELAQSWPEAHLDILTTNQYGWLAAASFWAALFIIVALYFARRRAVLWMFTAILFATICGGSLFAIYTLENGSAGRDVAIVTGKNIQARLATADNAGTVLVLPPGSEIKVLSTRGGWIYAGLPNELRGWIPAGSAENVRL